MHYLAVFSAKEGVSEEDLQRERDSWREEDMDELLHKECTEFERFETFGDIPRKIFFTIDADDPAVVDRLSRHFDSSWISEVYSVHITHPRIEDHTIIGG